MTHNFNIHHAKQYGLSEAIFLQNLIFWIRQNAANGRHLHEVDNKLYPEYEGQLRYWTYNSVASYAELFPYFSAKQVRNVIDSLLKQGVILKGNYSENKYDRTNWYALADEQKLEMDLPKRANGVVQKGKSIQIENQIENNNNNDDFDFPKPSKKQGELVSDEQDFFTGFEQEINTPPVQVVKPPKPIVTAKTTNVLRLNEIWGKDYAEQVVWLQKAGEEVAEWLQSGAEGLCQPNSFEGKDLAEMFVYWVGKETGRIFQSKNPNQWKTSICNYARVQKANGGFKSVTKSAPYPNAEANEAPKGFTPAKSRLSGKAFLDYVDKVKAAKAAGIITHAQAMEYINFHKQD